ncbi:hypothetical protein MRB53_035091 [Persea americana]|uniref:Uncharacterized protein n=1 Tax=Persea americana TaxID=3435 RepID=A0ACC2K3Y2_PERAE|nr:hypothetical protein MRB53_035091 [Persea americana]
MFGKFGFSTPWKTEMRLRARLSAGRKFQASPEIFHLVSLPGVAVLSADKSPSPVSPLPAITEKGQFLHTKKRGVTEALAHFFYCPIQQG